MRLPPRSAERLYRATRSVRGGARVLSAAGRLAGRAGLALPSFWWDAEPNFGDQLAPFVLGAATGKTPTWVASNVEGKVLGVGSLLNRYLRDGDAVWGTGALFPDRRIRQPPNSRFFAVRGPLTREVIDGDVPDVFGDPALLLPHYYTPTVPNRRYAIGIVPHLSDRESVTTDDASVLVIDVGSHWRTVIDAIASCDEILSSSLHGIVTAEAYGIPATWVQFGGRVFGGEFKFQDYYVATGRDRITPRRWSGTTTTSRPAPAMKWDAKPLLAAASLVARAN